MRIRIEFDLNKKEWKRVKKNMGTICNFTEFSFTNWDDPFILGWLATPEGNTALKKVTILEVPHA